MLRGCIAAAVCAAILASESAEQEWKHEKCLDPLFATHWSGKNDIQTFTATPILNTNLKLCPAYNQQLSCCHQTFETELQKYYDIWNRRFTEKILRAAAHRDALVATVQHLNGTSLADREQYEVGVRRYGQVLRPSQQEECFSSILTYVAGMICFTCKPDWFRYMIIEGNPRLAQSVLQVRMVRSVCLELWDSCKSFGESVVALQAALRDSLVARAVPISYESLDMFAGQQQLCDWMHDEVALHPFRMLSKENQALPDAGSAWALAREAASAGAGAAGGGAAEAPVVREPVRRRLEPVGELRKEAEALGLDVLQEGRQTSFNRTWHSPVAEPSGAWAAARALQWLVAGAVASWAL